MSKPKTIDYYGLTDAEKRVAIAKDVLARLSTRKIRARHQAYFETAGSVLQSGDLREVLQKYEAPCHVCALGALFYSQVMLGNGVTLSQERYGLFGDDEIKLKLAQVFSDEQMREIETAFEGNRLDDFGGSERALAFHVGDGSFQTAETRMRAIMKNIIKNKGTFKP